MKKIKTVEKMIKEKAKYIDASDHTIYKNDFIPGPTIVKNELSQ